MNFTNVKAVTPRLLYIVWFCHIYKDKSHDVDHVMKYSKYYTYSTKSYIKAAQNYNLVVKE